jgi:putative ABC transport system permease protein
MRAQWRHAPFVLRHHGGVVVAVFGAALLGGLSASGAPFLSTAAGSAALTNRLNGLSPLTTGIEIQRGANALPGSAALTAASAARRDHAVVMLTRGVGSFGTPVRTLETQPTPVTSATGAFDNVVVMSRSGALGHVKVLARAGGPGVWIADTTARALHVRPGATIRLQIRSPSVHPPSVRIRVAGVYRALAYQPERPYWSNFLEGIYPATPDAPVPAPFAFATRADFFRLARTIGAAGINVVDELAVDPRGLTLGRARSLDDRLRRLTRQLTAGTSKEARAAGCPCAVVSSLSDAITLADDSVGAISPVVALLSDLGIGIALAVAAAAGAFAVRRRQTEAALMTARGEHVAAFAGRTGLEALLPVVIGGLAGLGLAVVVTGLAAPRGTVDAASFRLGAERTAVVIVLALCVVVAAAATVFLRLSEASAPAFGRLTLLPWELVALGAGVYLLFDIRSGGGLAKSGLSGTSHPTLVVFVFPLMLAAGLMGIVARLGRTGLRRGFLRARVLPLPPFLAVRRLAAARGLLVALTVVLAVAFAAFFYAATVDESLTQSTLAKAYIGFGSDAEGQIAESASLPRTFPYPSTIVSYASGGAELGSRDGMQADVLTVDPRTLPAAVHWESGWGPPPRRLMAGLESRSTLPLPVIVSRSAPGSVRSIWIQGSRYPVRVVARVAAFPGMTANPLVVMSNAGLARASRALRIADPLVGAAVGYVWAKGPPTAVARALGAPGLNVSYVTSIDQFRTDPQVVLATRTYSYVRTVGLAAAVLALAGLVLYLQSRQQSQRIASALTRRMGLSAGSEILSLFLELSTILLSSAAVGVGVAAASASPVVRHIDVLPQFPPPPVATGPAAVAVLLVAVLIVVAACTAAATCVLSRRTDVSEDLRVG